MHIALPTHSVQLWLPADLPTQDGCGFISLEEAMQIMYLRYGRAQLDYQLEEIFGTSDLNSGKLLTLTEFLHCLKSNQVSQKREEGRELDSLSKHC